MNLVPNPSFEEGFAGWTTWERSGDVEFVVDNEVARTGNASALIRTLPSVDEQGEPVNPRGNLLIKIPVDTTDKIVAISAWYKGTVPESAVMLRAIVMDVPPGSSFSRYRLRQQDTFLPFYDAEYGTWQVTSGGDFNIRATSIDPDEWKELRAYIIWPADGQQLQLDLFSNNVAGELWWDDVSVTILD